MSGGAAFFDVDGTIVAGNVVRYYANLATLEFSPARRALWTAWFALRVPRYIALDRVDRARFQAALYGNYRRFTPEDLASRARTHWERHLAPHLFPAALECIAAHRARGEPVVLVTGSLRPIVAPLAAHVGADALLAADLEVRDGRHTGALAGGPLASERKAEALARYVADHGLDARACHAYADSPDDVAMLRRVGHPHAVNAGARLARIASREGWDLLEWRR